MKRLLVATDLSSRSKPAVEKAFALAGQHQAALDVMHVVDADLPPTIVDVHITQANEAILEQIDTIASSGRIRATPLVVAGHVYAEIIARSVDNAADLIILGITRHTRSLFRGTTSERIIRFGQVPVLVVRASSVAPYSRVVVGVDLSVHSRRAVAFAAELAPAAQIFCVQASHEPFVGFLGDATRQQLVSERQRDLAGELETDIAGLCGRLATPRERFHIEMRTGNPRAVIWQCIHELKADLVVTGTHGRGAVARAVVGSFAEDCLAEAPVDASVVKAW
jgi:nucleotide-binding universal stress UspA family protein